MKAGDTGTGAVRLNAEEAEAGGHLGFKLSSRPAWGSEPDLVVEGTENSVILTLVLISRACPIVLDGVRAVPIHSQLTLGLWDTDSLGLEISTNSTISLNFGFPPTKT